MRTTVHATITVFCAAAWLIGQEGGSAKFAGRVTRTDTKAAISGASVLLRGSGTPIQATTDKSGSYAVSVPPGKYSVTISVASFKPPCKDDNGNARVTYYESFPNVDAPVGKPVVIDIAVACR